MNEECNGCYLIRIFVNDTLKPCKPEQLTCEHENLPCPCKNCLVKITCDIIDNGQYCEPYYEFNFKYNKNHYWAGRRRNANQIQSRENTK